MYQEIDELVQAIEATEEFKNYQNALKQLSDEKVLALLSRYQGTLEDYRRIKDYSMDMGQEELKKQLQQIQKEMQQQSAIAYYYQTYHELNDLLEEVTKLVFQDISPQLHYQRWKL